MLLVGDEDGLATSVRPHLELLGADLTRILAVRGVTTTGPNGADHVVALELGNVSLIDSLMGEHKPALVVVDPVQAHLGADVDMNRANEVRPVLAGLARLAEKHGAAIVLVRHLSKGGAGDKGVYRGLGSIDFMGAARSALALHQHPDPERPDVRVLLHAKANASRKAPPLEFEIGDGGRLEWLGESNVSESELREAEMPKRPGGGKRGRPAEARVEAEEWLREALADGPVETQRLLARGEDAGHAESTLRRAAAALGVEFRRPRSGKGGAPTVPGTWTLPDEAQSDAPPEPRARKGSIYETPGRESSPSAPRFNNHPPRASASTAHAEGGGPYAGEVVFSPPTEHAPARTASESLRTVEFDKGSDQQGRGAYIGNGKWTGDADRAH